MIQPGRSYNVAAYRYGFNGKENDNDIKGTANQQDYGMRIYDPRIAKFLSVDPITKQFPELTPYQFASNTPILAIDLDGLEAVVYNNPKQMLYQAGGEISDAIGRIADKFSNSWEGGLRYFEL